MTRASETATGSPPTRADAALSAPGRFVVVAAATAILAIFVQSAAAVVGPVLLAAFLAVVADRPLRWMLSRGVPRLLALGLILFALVDVGSFLALLVTGTLEDVQQSLPTYQERLRLLAADVGAWLERRGLAGGADAAPDLLDPRALGPFVRAGLAGAGDALGTGLLVLLAVAFMLQEGPSLRVKFRAIFGEDADRRLGATLEGMSRYMLIKSAMSLMTAAALFVVFRALGLDFAPFMAVVAFLANFVPFVGTFIMLAPALLLTLVQADLETAGLVAAAVVAVNTLVGSILEPKVMGRGLGISTLAVFLSLMVWGWMLGPLGAVLAVPLTFAIIAVLESHPATRPIAVLCGPDLPPAEGGGRSAAGEVSGEG